MTSLRNSIRKCLAAAACAIALAVIAAPPPQLAAASLSQLRGVDELKSWFNAYKGRPRLIFLLSPT
jgi:hypothetical protein